MYTGMKKPDYILDNSLIVWHGTLFMQIHGCIELLLPSKWLELAIKIDPLSNKSYTRLSILYWVTNIILECFPSSWKVAKSIKWFHQRHFLMNCVPSLFIYVFIYIYIISWIDWVKMSQMSITNISSNNTMWSHAHTIWILI